MTTEQLTKVTVYLVPEAIAALDGAHELTELTRTETINRALRLYWAIQRAANKAVELGNEHGYGIEVDGLQGDDFNFEIVVRFVPSDPATD